MLRPLPDGVDMSDGFRRADCHSVLSALRAVMFDAGAKAEQLTRGSVGRQLLSKALRDQGVEMKGEKTDRASMYLAVKTHDGRHMYAKKIYKYMMSGRQQVVFKMNGQIRAGGRCKIPRTRTTQESARKVCAQIRGRNRSPPPSPAHGVEATKAHARWMQKSADGVHAKIRA